MQEGERRRLQRQPWINIIYLRILNTIVQKKKKPKKLILQRFHQYCVFIKTNHSKWLIYFFIITQGIKILCHIGICAFFLNFVLLYLFVSVLVPKIVAIKILGCSEIFLESCILHMSFN